MVQRWVGVKLSGTLVERPNCRFLLDSSMSLMSDSSGIKPQPHAAEALREMREAQVGGVEATLEEQRELEAALTYDFPFQKRRYGI